MQLTKHTDYGLRILIYLALLPGDTKSSIDKISNSYDISRNNVNKLVHLLGKEGFIKTKMGKSGGISLGKPPSEINIGELVRLLENTCTLVNCQTPYCKITPACTLPRIFSEAVIAFMSVLDKYTLADVLQSKDNDLREILDIKMVD